MRVCDDPVTAARYSDAHAGLMQRMDIALLTATEDETLLDELCRAIADSDPVPPAVQAEARSALAWGRFEADFAALVAAGSSD